jgi:S1-C subfamily serine protease
MERIAGTAPRHRVNEPTTLTVWRNGETLTLDVMLQGRGP